MPLVYDDVPGSWGKQSEGWPAIHDPDGTTRGLVIQNKLVPYGSYVTVDDELRLETSEYVAKVRAALASKRPPPSAPVGVEGLKARAWELLQAEYDRDYFTGNYEDAAIDAIIVALSQQPAADERPVGWWNGILPDVTDRSPYGPSIHWSANAENDGHDIPLYAGVNPSRVQQPAAVDEAMVERVTEAVVGWATLPGDSPAEPELVAELREVISAALAGQQGTDHD